MFKTHTHTHTHREYFTSGRGHVLVLFAECTEMFWLALYARMSQASLLHVCLGRTECCTFYYTYIFHSLACSSYCPVIFI